MNNRDVLQNDTSSQHTEAHNRCSVYSKRHDGAERICIAVQCQRHYRQI